MKNCYKFLLIISLFFFQFCENNQSNFNFTINGKIENYDFSSIYLFKIENDSIVDLDSCTVENQKFKFAGKCELPELYYISDNKFENYFSIFIENSKMEFYSKTSNFEDAELTGSESQQKFLEFVDNISVYDHKLISIKKQYQTIDSLNILELKNLDSSFLAIKDERLKFIKNYIYQNNNSNVSAYIAYKILLHEISSEEMNEIILFFDKKLNNSYYIKQITQKLIMI